MTDKVRVGIIGTSGWAEIHLGILKSHPQADIQAICGRNQKRATEVATKHTIPQVYADYRAMINQANLDAIAILTPDYLHYPMTMTALDAGLHILGEKPMAMTLGQAKEMTAKAKAVGVKTMMMFSWRWNGYAQYIKHLLDEGYLEDPYYCQLRQVGGYGRETPPGHWKWDDKQGLGILGDLGAHMIDQAMWLCGDIKRVSASLSTYGQHSALAGEPAPQTNDSAVLTLEFANAAQGSIHVSAVAHTSEERGMTHKILLEGQTGLLEATSHLRQGAVIHGGRGTEHGIKVLPIPGDFLSYDEQKLSPYNQWMEIMKTRPIGPRLFIDSILADKAITPNFDDGLKVQAVIESAFQSAREGRWVDVPEV